MTTKEIKHNLAILEASRWIGVTEQGGNNKGQIVQMFQKTIDGVASAEAWCMAFVQSVVRNSEKYFDVVMPDKIEESALKLFASEHCLTVWSKTDSKCRVKTPSPGSIVIWQHGNSSSGHTGIVLDIDLKSKTMTTIEGNTGTEDDTVVREGDGVYKRKRSMVANGDMKVVGFLNAWGS